MQILHGGRGRQAVEGARRSGAALCRRRLADPLSAGTTRRNEVCRLEGTRRPSDRRRRERTSVSTMSGIAVWRGCRRRRRQVGGRESGWAAAAAARRGACRGQWPGGALGTDGPGPRGPGYPAVPSFASEEGEGRPAEATGGRTAERTRRRAASTSRTSVSVGGGHGRRRRAASPGRGHERRIGRVGGGRRPRSRRTLAGMPGWVRRGTGKSAAGFGVTRRLAPPPPSRAAPPRSPPAHPERRSHGDHVESERLCSRTRWAERREAGLQQCSLLVRTPPRGEGRRRGGARARRGPRYRSASATAVGTSPSAVSSPRPPSIAGTSVAESASSLGCARVRECARQRRRRRAARGGRWLQGCEGAAPAVRLLENRGRPCARGRREGGNRGRAGRRSGRGSPRGVGARTVSLVARSPGTAAAHSSGRGSRTRGRSASARRRRTTRGTGCDRPTSARGRRGAGRRGRRRRERPQPNPPTRARRRPGRTG